MFELVVDGRKMRKLTPLERARDVEYCSSRLPIPEPRHTPYPSCELDGIACFSNHSHADRQF